MTNTLKNPMSDMDYAAVIDEVCRKQGVDWGSFVDTGSAIEMDEFIMDVCKAIAAEVTRRLT